MSTSIIPQQACKYCRKPYTPTKRWGQKYCGSACRVAACNERAGRAHPKENAASKSRRRKALGRTPSAVITSEAAATNREILALLMELGQRMTAMEQQQQQLFDLLSPVPTALP
jgi:hypothetical protein